MGGQAVGAPAAFGGGQREALTNARGRNATGQLPVALRHRGTVWPSPWPSPGPSRESSSSGEQDSSLAGGVRELDLDEFRHLSVLSGQATPWAI